MKKFMNIVLIVILTLFIFIPSSVSAAEPITPDLPRVIDDGELLTTDEEKILGDKIKTISTQYSMDIVILTTNSFNGKSDRDYSDDYYDYNNYGYGPNGDGILLVVNLPERKWYISTKGTGTQYFSDSRIQLIGDSIKDFLSDAEYSEAFHAFLNISTEFLQSSPNDPKYNSAHDNALVDTATRDIAFELMVAGGICLVISIIIVSIMAFTMNNARKNDSAMAYTGKNGINLTAHHDIFTHSHTSKSKKAESSSSSGGSSTHTSSSGSSHGGGGGSF